MKKYSKLRGRIIEKYGSQRAFADAIDTSEQTVVKKLNMRGFFSREDIIKWCNALDIIADEVGSYFFAEELSKS